MLIGRIAENGWIGYPDDALILINSANTYTIGHFIARTYTGIGACVTASKHGLFGGIGHDITYGESLYANVFDDTVRISPLWICEQQSGSALIRGRLRGLWDTKWDINSNYDWPHHVHGEYIQGSGDCAGKVFMVISPSSHYGVFLIEVSDTLETN